ncbi:ATP-dependent nuclease [Modestobacter italicus]|uniref:ATP-dependent nuclease n=1 Tax=Modestobacter italicus (strain DSM 44449 / CECT 9708 / BC 501) TaxID=2732864 RepID=UPI0014125C54|nr:AAA family ATPase [Modestobacter marinus]
MPNLYQEVPTGPLQKTWADRALEERVQVLAMRAFGIDLTLNRHGGAQIGLHVGRPTTPEPAVGQPSPYIAEVASLPLVAQQGHGVQAFLGMVLTLMAGQYDIVLIDEPEAFLHPPQARLLGEVFVDLAKQRTQLLVSTHSDDFLRGVLQASASATDVTIARLTRPEPAVNAVAQLPPAAVRGLFEDPLLRYSNILSGIFYKGVVLCEAEGDCQYYAAVLDNKFTRAEAAVPRPDLLFTQCGGKDRFAKAARALLSTQVPTAIIADIDLLADRSKFVELLTVLGGDPTSLSAALNTVESALSAQATKPDRAFTRYRIIERIDASTEPSMSPSEVREVRDLLRSRSGWELAKKNGVGALPSGNPVDAFNAILAAAKSVGLFILPIGELERFHPEVGGNKQTWLRQVFEESLYTSSPEAEQLLSDVVAFIATKQ